MRMSRLWILNWDQRLEFSDISIGNGGLFAQKEPDGFTSVGKLSSGRLEGNGFNPYVL